MAQQPLTLAQALERLPDSELIHTRAAGIGAERSRASLVELLQRAAERQAQPGADPCIVFVDEGFPRVFKHRLLVDDGQGWLSIEDREPDAPPDPLCGYEIPPRLAELGTLRVEYQPASGGTEARWVAYIQGLRVVRAEDSRDPLAGVSTARETGDAVGAALSRLWDLVEQTAAGDPYPYLAVMGGVSVNVAAGEAVITGAPARSSIYQGSRRADDSKVGMRRALRWRPRPRGWVEVQV